MIADALMSRATTLRGLYMSCDTEVAVGAMVSFAEALRSNCKLSMLQIYLGNCYQLGAPKQVADAELSVVLLCRGLETNTNLQELRVALYKAREGSSGTTALCTLIRQNMTLRHLLLSDTEQCDAISAAARQRPPHAPLQVLFGEATSQRAVAGNYACGDRDSYSDERYLDENGIIKDPWCRDITRPYPQSPGVGTCVGIPWF
jgi:hypothetical protein